MSHESRDQVEQDLKMRELVEIEKMRNLELARLEADFEEMEIEKEQRISKLEVALWHSNRRADDLDRRWNELAQSYEQVKTDLERTGAALMALQQQRSYRLLTKCISIAKLEPLRKLIRGSSGVQPQ